MRIGTSWTAMATAALLAGCATVPGSIGDDGAAVRLESSTAAPPDVSLPRVVDRRTDELRAARARDDGFVLGDVRMVPEPPLFVARALARRADVEPPPAEVELLRFDVVFSREASNSTRYRDAAAITGPMYGALGPLVAAAMDGIRNQWNAMRSVTVHVVLRADGHVADWRETRQVDPRQPAADVQFAALEAVRVAASRLSYARAVAAAAAATLPSAATPSDDARR